MKNKVSIQDVINLLNDIHLKDPDAANDLLNARVRCNEEIANHSDIQVGEDEEGFPVVGILGILNGLFGVDERGRGAICVKGAGATGRIDCFDWFPNYSGRKVDEGAELEEAFLTTGELAGILRVNSRTIKRWRESRGLPYVFVSNNRIRYRWRDIEYFLETQRLKAKSKDYCPEPDESP